MALQSSGTISMNDMRSEFGFGSSSISMSQLYRGGSYVDAGGKPSFFSSCSPEPLPPHYLRRR